MNAWIEQSASRQSAPAATPSGGKHASFADVRTVDPLRAELLRSRLRWEIVNARATEEVRRATLEEKFDEIERLMESIDDFGWRRSTMTAAFATGGTGCGPS